MATYRVEVGLRGEGYAKRIVVVEIRDEYRNGDLAAHHAAAKRMAIEQYMDQVEARVLGGDGDA